MDNPPSPPLPPPAQPPPSIQSTSGSYQRPADYYASPPAPGQKSGCPRWLVFGCGGLGCLALIAIFGLGWFGMRAGGGALFGWVFGQLEEQSSRMIAGDVTAEQRQAFKREFSRLQNNIKQKRIALREVQSILNTFRSASNDNSLDAGEVEELTRSMKAANDHAEGSSSDTRSVSARTGRWSVHVPVGFCPLPGFPN